MTSTDRRLTVGSAPAALAAAATLAIAAFGWLVVLGQAGMATSMTAGWSAAANFRIMWAAMIVAMMLPSAVPVVVRLARVGAGPRTAVFLLVYLAIWSGMGVLAFALNAALSSFPNGIRMPAGGVVLVIGGVYWFSRFRKRTETTCRTIGGHSQLVGEVTTADVVRTGATYSMSCVACTGGLMAALVVIGISNLFWMVVLSGMVLVYKVLPRPGGLGLVTAVTLVAAGLVIALFPAWVPPFIAPQTM